MSRAEIIFDGKKLNIPDHVGKPLPHQFQSTTLDNLIELSGRICYDSVGIKKSRNTKEYHEHIIEVGHLSVQEHANKTFLVPFNSIGNESYFTRNLLNRPGLWVSVSDFGYRLTMNVRTVREWYNWGIGYSLIGDCISYCMKQEAPLAMSGISCSKNSSSIRIVEPISDEELWVSFLLKNISRNCTHELVRHGDFTAISQRSTRYVDESESSFIDHPIISKIKEKEDLNDYKDCQNSSIEVYKKLYDRCYKFLVDENADKSSARKQARGAARGILGGNLATEMIFSTNIAQLKRILLMRGHPSADDEIRYLAVDMFDEICKYYKNRFANWQKKPMPSPNFGFFLEKGSE